MLTFERQVRQCQVDDQNQTFKAQALSGRFTP
jgi:hypothetical protein